MSPNISRLVSLHSNKPGMLSPDDLIEIDDLDDVDRCSRCYDVEEPDDETEDNDD